MYLGSAGNSAPSEVAMIFVDRIDGGRRLAERLMHLRDKNVVVVGLPRGGVPVAAVVATALNAPLDVILVRKLGVPSQPELAMGAIGEDDVRVLNDEVIQLTGVTADEIVQVEARERIELERRVKRFRAGLDAVSLTDRVVVVVDDGIATGSTARAACQVVRARGASYIVLAVPVAPPGWERDLAGVADEYVCVATPGGFSSVGQFYSDFTQVTDDDVVVCLNQAIKKPK
jgi:putative phosphoribosyl transferase